MLFLISLLIFSFFFNYGFLHVLCFLAIKQISKDSSKRISKKDRKEQRAEFRVIEDFVVSCTEQLCLFILVQQAMVR